MSKPQGPAMIEAIGLSKYYGDFAAIEDVTFSIPKGQVVAFLGPNGAGKSTTMKLLTGYLAPSTGVGPHRRPRHGDRSAGRLGPAGLSARKRPALSRHDPAELLEFFADARGMSPAAQAASGSRRSSSCVPWAA